MATFITKRQQQALRCLQAGHLYSSAIQPGNWFSCNIQSGFFSTCTINTLIDAGWVGRGVLPDIEKSYDGEEVIALTPEGRKLARLLCGSK